MTTLNPADKSSEVILSNGNLTANVTSPLVHDPQVRSTTFKTTGKFHFECTMISSTSDSVAVGFSNTAHPFTGGSYLGVDVYSLGNYNDSYYAIDAAFPTLSVAYNTGDTMAMEVDFDAQLAWVINITQGGTWNGTSANPGTGTGGQSFSTLNSGIAFYATLTVGRGSIATDSVTINFGNSPFLLTPSSGFSAWDPQVPSIDTPSSMNIIRVKPPGWNWS